MSPVILMWCLGLVSGQCSVQGSIPVPTAELCFQAKEVLLDEAATDEFTDNFAKCVTIVEISPAEVPDES